MAEALFRASAYHAHVYFEDAELAAATRLHAAAERELGAIARVWPLRARCVGPHTRPMFEIEFGDAVRDRVIDWVAAHRGGFSVLLHPETGNDLVDHRDRAVWLGERLALKLDVLS